MAFVQGGSTPRVLFGCGAVLSQKGLVLSLDRGLPDLGRHRLVSKVLGGDLGEVVLLGARGGRLLGGSGRGRATTDHLLGLVGVVTHVLLGHLGGLGRVLASHLSELLGLAVDNV